MSAWVATPTREKRGIAQKDQEITVWGSQMPYPTAAQLKEARAVGKWTAPNLVSGTWFLRIQNWVKRRARVERTTSGHS